MKTHIVRLVLIFAAAVAWPAFPVRAGETAGPAAEQLARLVEAFVQRDEIVGAELLVIQDGVPLVHRAFGFADREAKRPMQLNQFFAVRSMTKPFTGMAAQMLVDEGKLELDAPVARYLPAFDHPKSSAVTVRQLLTHRGGFPFVSDPGKPLKSYAGGLQEIAERAGERGPDHEPGSRFVYSDVGSDVLGALVARVSEMSWEDFIRVRILQPLALRDVFPEREAVSPERRERVVARYFGIAGHWTRYWGADDEPIYPFLKGSGGLFATAVDYAKFLQAWIEREDGAAGPLLARAGFARALTPASRETMPAGFPGATVDYGQMWMLYRKKGDLGETFAFGHGGSDGTHAYAFPARKLIVCYFTQTRGNETPARFEEALSHLFLQPNPAAMARLLEPPAANVLEEFTGLFARKDGRGGVAAIMELGGTLAFEMPGRMLMRLRATEERDRWVPDRAPGDQIVFHREDGRVVGFSLHRKGQVDEVVRFKPDPALPTREELASLRARAGSDEALAELLPLRMTGRIRTNGGDLRMTVVHGAGGRSLTEIDLPDGGKVRVWTAPDGVWRQMPGGKAAVEVRGPERAEQLAGTLFAEYGDWSRHFKEVVVLGRETLDGREVFRVRTVPHGGLASTKLVDVENGSILAEFGLTLSAGGGPQGMEVRRGDFRRVEGLTLSAAQTISFPGTPGATTQVLVESIEPRAAQDEALLNRP